MSILVAKCKTEECENDLRVDGQDVPGFDPERPTIVRAKLFDTVNLTCGICHKTYSYGPTDCFEKAR
jgi:hypothetical protein